MRYLLLFAFLVTAVPVYAQSGRAPVNTTPDTAAVAEQTLKQMFDEANGYIRTKAAEFDAKKIQFSTELFDKTKLEQRQLAAKHAASALTRKSLSGDDQYYLGMLHWIAENLGGAEDALRKFTASEPADPARLQTARSVLIVVLAKLKKVADAEAVLADYQKSEPKKLTERSRIGSEMAKAYQAAGDFVKMTPHAESSYAATKLLLADAASRARGLDEILDAGMLVYEAHRDAGEQKRADEALEDMRATAALVGSASFYYYAVDQRIKYMIETGRKPAALAYYSAALASSARDFREKTAGDDITRRLRRREVHYKLLGESVPELLAVDTWFPGQPRLLKVYRGKVVLLDFWATWCAPCFEAFPSLIEWHRDWNRDGFEILGITRYYPGKEYSLPEEPAAQVGVLKELREKQKLPYDFVVTTDQSTQILFGATSLPTAVLIDRKGVIRYIEAGTSSTRLVQMREMVQKLLAEK